MLRIFPRSKPFMAACALSLLMALGQAIGGGSPAAADTPVRANESSFIATVTAFRTSANDSTKFVTAIVRFQNKTKKPLILGYVRDSATATDDQGNKYSPYGENTMRGIGIITPSDLDPKFVLQPGEAADARFDVGWRRPGQNVVYGTSYTFDLTVRELAHLNATQYRQGTEHVLQFLNLKDKAPTASDSAYTGPGAPSAPIGGDGNSKPNFYSAGPFTAEVTHLEATNPARARNQVITVTVNFTNVSDKPIILGYTARTSDIIDNLGNHYAWGTAGSSDRSASGIGTVASTSAGADFALAPGESRNAKLTLFRRLGGGSEIGTSFDYGLAVEMLEILPSGQVHSKRQYNLNFTNLSSATGR